MTKKKDPTLEEWPRERLIAVLRMVASMDVFNPIDTSGIKRLARQAIGEET